MYSEARLFIEALKLTPTELTRNPGLGEIYSGEIGHLKVIVSINPFNQRFQVAGVGTNYSTLCAMALCNEVKPDLLINAGTGGGFKSGNTSIGDTFISQGAVYYHDRRIPLPAFEDFGRGGYPTVRALVLPDILNAKTGIFSTGNSLDLSEADKSELERNNADVKDMESAAFAEVADSNGVPFLAIRTITDFVDSGRSTPEQFTSNFNHATGKLRTALMTLVSYLAEETRLIGDL
jgi:nucleoside phosphorylase